MFNLLKGGEIGKKVKDKRRYSETEAIRALRSMLKALAYLRTHNVVHRDLHMANWCLRTEEDDTDIVMVDFGWACPLKER